MESSSPVSRKTNAMSVKLPSGHVGQQIGQIGPCDQKNGSDENEVCPAGIQKFRTQNRSGQQSDEVPPPPPPPPPPKKKKKKKKNVVAKTNDIVIYASRCITTFPELSKVLFHFILKKKPK